MVDLDQEQVLKAISSLLNFLGKKAQQSDQLFADDDEYIYLIFDSNNLFKLVDRVLRFPRRPVPHPLYSSQGVDVCLIVPDKGQVGSAKQAKEKIQGYENMASISKVLPVNKLRTKYESFEAKRNLLNSYDMFLADDRLVPILPKLVGKAFFNKKKQPIPVDLRRANWQKQIEKAVNSVSFVPRGGSCVSCRVGRSSQSAPEIAANTAAVFKALLPMTPKNGKRVVSVFIKSTSSIALPVWQRMPESTPSILQLEEAEAAKGAIEPAIKKKIKESRADKKGSKGTKGGKVVVSTAAKKVKLLQKSIAKKSMGIKKKKKTKRV